MEVRNARQATYATVTRVYSPTHGSSAYAYAQPAVAPQPNEEVRTPDRQAPKPAQMPRQKAKPHLNAGCRMAMMFTIFVLGSVALLAVFRYHTIAEEYAKVHALQKSIEETQLRIRTLNVSLECAVDIQTLQDAAARMGMTYPSASQYVRAGDAVPVLERPQTDDDVPIDPAVTEPDV